MSRDRCQLCPETRHCQPDRRTAEFPQVREPRGPRGLRARQGLPLFPLTTGTGDDPIEARWAHGRWRT